MIKDMEHTQDDKTILLNRKGKEGHHAREDAEPLALTDFDAPPRFEQLEDRMIYAARLRPAESFNISLNALVAAGAGLLSEVVRIKHATGAENMAVLNERLTKELEQFESRALHHGADAGQVKAAQYVLCTVADEAVVTTQWGNESEWSRMSLLSSFHSETFGGEKFFSLLDRLSKNPVKHLPMLELMYLCLSMGFEGKYRVMERGVTELEGVRDALYRQIRHVRGDPVSVSASVPRPEPARRKRLRTLSATWCVALGLIALLAMYSATAWVLEQERAHALQPFQSSAPELTPTPL